MKKFSYGVVALIAIYILLLIPPQHHEAPKLMPAESPFVRDQDELWQHLERSFQSAKNMDPEQLASLIESKTVAASGLLRDYEASERGPIDPIYEQLESGFFEVTPLIAARPGDSDWHIRYYQRVRTKIKNDSSIWDSSARASRDTIYRHVAIIYVEQGTNKPHTMEAHIDKGVTIANTADYLKDSKLRLMVLRPRSDLPEMIANPMLPHQAAEFIFNEAGKRHIPCDFAMDYFDSTAMFCSEVGSYAYRHFGISLWEPKSTVSSEGIVRWLTTFGVENFLTLLPADLEYDPSLSVVAEWRDRETLVKDHIDNDPGK